jgi:hypothetical protein
VRLPAEGDLRRQPSRASPARPARRCRGCRFPGSSGRAPSRCAGASRN